MLLVVATLFVSGTLAKATVKIVYWTEDEYIRKGYTDGSPWENLYYMGGVNKGGITLDAENDVLYWTEDEYVRRGHTDGSPWENLYYMGGVNKKGIVVTPEPATLLLLSLGGVALWRRRKA